MTIAAHLVLVMLAGWSLAWGAAERARDANRLYDKGRYEAAAEKYDEALRHEPTSVLLRFNLGDALYKQGRYREALAVFEDVAARDDEPRRAGRVAYNIGNTQYRLGELLEARKPHATMRWWTGALAAYRRAMAFDPRDLDAKFNHELVAERLTALRKRIGARKLPERAPTRDRQTRPSPTRPDFTFPRPPAPPCGKPGSGAVGDKGERSDRGGTRPDIQHGDEKRAESTVEPAGRDSRLSQPGEAADALGGSSREDKDTCHAIEEGQRYNSPEGQPREGASAGVPAGTAQPRPVPAPEISREAAVALVQSVADEELRPSGELASQLARDVGDDTGPIKDW